MNINNIHLSIIHVISNFIYPNLWTTVIPCAAPRQWGGCLVAALTDDLDPGGGRFPTGWFSQLQLHP